MRKIRDFAFRISYILLNQ